jgi:hypothetical protein
MKPLSEDINKILKKIFYKQSPYLYEILTHWQNIVGPKFSSKSYPLKITRIKEKGETLSVLYIATKNSSISLEMSFQRDIIIERIAVYFGFKVIHKIKLTLIP